jgi:hypothetical protein
VRWLSRKPPISFKKQSENSFEIVTRLCAPQGSRVDTGKVVAASGRVVAWSPELVGHFGTLVGDPSSLVGSLGASVAAEVMLVGLIG